MRLAEKCHNFTIKEMECQGMIPTLIAVFPSWQASPKYSRKYWIPCLRQDSSCLLNNVIQFKCILQPSGINCSSYWKNGTIITILPDRTKGFETFPHGGLLVKLHEYEAKGKLRLLLVNMYKNRHCVGDYSFSKEDSGYEMCLRNFYETSHALGHRKQEARSQPYM